LVELFNNLELFWFKWVRAVQHAVEIGVILISCGVLVELLISYAVSYQPLEIYLREYKLEYSCFISIGIFLFFLSIQNLSYSGLAKMKFFNNNGRFIHRTQASTMIAETWASMRTIHSLLSLLYLSILGAPESASTPQESVFYRVYKAII